MMTLTTPNISQLATKANEIPNAADCIKYLPAITSKNLNREEAEHVVHHIVAVIKRETQWEQPQCCDKENKELESVVINQAVLNVAVRCYYQLLRRHSLPEQHLNAALREHLTCSSNFGFQLLFAMLLSERGDQLELSAEQLRAVCLEVFGQAVERNEASILAILKAMNLLCKKHAHLEMEVTLDHIYYCLQSGQSGMREETLILFAHCCRQPRRAFEYFQVVLEFWPWTNRNKYYLLSGILNSHKLPSLLESAQHAPDEFYAGIRLSLHYKSLLAASQYLVKALSNQNDPQLLTLAVEILTRGSLKEIQNFHAQWFGRIAQKDALFEQLQQQPEVARFLDDTVSSADSTENYRLILIFSMFARQIFAASKLHFFKISTELITNCFHYEVEAQLLIYKFIVENFSSFALEDCLEFIVAFIKKHRGVESAQYRNTMLGKVPTVINYVAIAYSKMCQHMASTTLEASVKSCFEQLQQIIETDIDSNVYQPKIFALQLLELLLKSLYAEQVQKNAKNCSLAHNQKLGAFLIEQQIFKADAMGKQLLDLLNDPQGFDDALELIVELLQQLKYADVKESAERCRMSVQSNDVDEGMLSALYARVSMQCCKMLKTETPAMELYKYAMARLENTLESFEQDPLLACKDGQHLFGCLNVINEIAQAQPSLLEAEFNTLLELLDRILNLILRLLNVANSKLQNGVVTPTAASFQDIDESLEQLVQDSAVAVDDHAESRKFLLMSFWLTLKGCCDLATTIGYILVPNCETNMEQLSRLKQCLHINVTVLTRCRHKGAIEAAGVSIGRLTKSITSKLSPNTAGYKLLYNCLKLLFDNDQQISTTRRGAGFSIMFLHIVKNEASRERSILKRAMSHIMLHLRAPNSQSKSSENAANCDRIEALTLHYLCVLVKDTELRPVMFPYYNEIVLLAVEHIEHAEWTVCNAALQLFGALLPKLVGQKQATEFEEPVGWEIAEVTYDEIKRKLPQTCAYILHYCDSHTKKSGTATRSLILFLGFLAKVEYLKKDLALNENVFLSDYRALMWRLLGHSCEKVRRLAALCFVRTHEFRCELPQLLHTLAALLYRVNDENLFEGLLYVLHEGVLKLQHEGKHTLNGAVMKDFMDQLRTSLGQTEEWKRQGEFKSYTLSKLLDLFVLVGFGANTPVVSELIKLRSAVSEDIGYDVWLQSVAQVNN